MHWLFEQLIENIQLTGEIPTDANTFLAYHDCRETYAHSLRVAAEAKLLAAKFGVDESLAEIAGYFHDISAVFPSDQRCEIAQNLNVEILSEEHNCPMILHQKLSKVLARDVFEICDESILSAIECHTTLKSDASNLDKVVFIADKIQWDQEGKQPFLEAVQKGLECSLNTGVFRYIDYLWQRRHTLMVIHPWLVAAHKQLAKF